MFLPGKKSKRIAYGFAAAFLLSWMVYMLVRPSEIPLRDFSGFAYSGIILGWICTIHYRILQRNLRLRLTLLGGMMLLLFLIRSILWNYLDIPELQMPLTYCYYIPTTAIPVLTFMAVLRIRSAQTLSSVPGMRLAEPALLILWGIFMLFVFTNPLHQQFLQVLDPGTRHYIHGRLYPLYILWVAGFITGSFFLLLRTSRILAVRTRWYLPILPALLFGALLLIYLACDGSPEIRGFRLYAFQEVYCFLFLGLFEGCIQIGLIPSNMGYESLFPLSRIDAAIVDRQGEIRLHSASWSGIDQKDSDLVLHRQEIHGGAVLWHSDLKPVRHLNKEIREATQVIEEENEVIAQENRLQTEHLRYASRNRLYDRIAGEVMPQLEQINTLYTPYLDTGNAPLAVLSRIAVLGAFIKRKSNLILLGEQNGALSLEELFLALSESGEHLESAGIRLAILPAPQTLDLSVRVTSERLILSYDLFEAVAEEALGEAGTIAVRFHAVSPELNITIAADTDRFLLAGSWNESAIEELHADFQVSCEDETFYARLRFPALPISKEDSLVLKKSGSKEVS